MYLAEIHGKLSRENENKEDILTSNVFSFFKYTDRSIFLYRFLDSLGLDLSIQDAIDAEFSFWPTFDDHTEPDLVIIVGNYYLLVEAKYLSGFGEETENTKHQLVREIQGGMYESIGLDKSFRIIAVTADYCKPPDIDKEIPPEFHRYFQWINWQKIAFFINQTLESSPALSAEMRLLADDLYRLLLKKNLRQFEGVKALMDSKMLSHPFEQVFFEASTASYRGDFIGFLHAFESDLLLKRPPSRIFFAAATATFRGDFIGFTQALHADPQCRLKMSPTIIFFSTNSQKQFFSFEGGNKLKAPEERIFFNGGTNE
jgi:hypothetical protein